MNIKIHSVTQILLLVFLSCPLFALDISLPPIHKAYEGVFSEGDRISYPSLPELEEDNPMLRLCETNGIAFGVPYFLIKSRLRENESDIVGALHYARLADACIAWCTPPENPALAKLYQQEMTKLTADLCLLTLRNSRALGKHRTAEEYAYSLLSMPTIDQEKKIEGMQELIQLYITQARFDDAYSLCTNLHSISTVLPKESFVIKADVAFHLDKSQEAFTDLLTILYTDGVHTTHPEKDPALQLFLKRIGRAEKEDILALYDALKAQLDYETLEKGKEDVISGSS